MSELVLTKEVNGSTHVRVDELESYLRRSLRGRVRDLQLLRFDNGLVLRGHARSYYLKQLAQHTLLSASPLPLLANEIIVS